MTKEKVVLMMGCSLPPERRTRESVPASAKASTNCRGLSAEDYARNLQKIYTVKTVQEFWQVYNNIPSVEQLDINYNYHLMRKELRPIREDQAHKDGGSWRCKCFVHLTKSIWEDILLAAIGEQLSDDPTELLGVSVALRQNEHIIQIWHSKANAQHESQIPEKLEHVVNDKDFSVRCYKAHHSLSSYHGGSGNNGGRSGRSGNRIF
ncbi:hypothetical protein BIW11_07653 [Tropilaelaps mercedesae]|uniref:Eukaryotic translation initiation factor 4E type 3-like n=1 Tax=Tropilaelaps mercedesae TaxID=418985 RepID=A0A1V9XT18_9ACAR|nr:hypothetical protein BIW11_07653 [Tropilaelaps mercedesae]